MSGLSLVELEAEALEVLPDRNTMALINIGSISLLNGLNVLNNNNIGLGLNLLADGNKNDFDQVNNSNDLVTCVIGLAFDGNGCGGGDGRRLVCPPHPRAHRGRLRRGDLGVRAADADRAAVDVRAAPR